MKNGSLLYRNKDEKLSLTQIEYNKNQVYSNQSETKWRREKYLPQT